MRWPCPQPFTHFQRAGTRLANERERERRRERKRERERDGRKEREIENQPDSSQHL